MRIIKAFGYSIAGFKSCFKSEAAFREEVYLSIILVPLAFILSEDKVELMMLIIPVFIVLIVEMLNTAIEYVVDRVGLDHHELSGKAKDIASAAVFLSLALLAFMWVTVLWG